MEFKNKIPKLFIMLYIIYHTPLFSGFPTHTLASKNLSFILIILPTSKQAGHENKHETWRHSDAVGLIMLFNGKESLLPSLI